MSAKKGKKKPTLEEVALLELYRWGRYLKVTTNITSHLSGNDGCWVYGNQPQSNLGRLQDLGVGLIRGHCFTSDHDDEMKQVRRVWAFMPSKIQSVVILHFGADGTKKAKAANLGIDRKTFDSRLEKGIEFYTRFRDTDFTRFNRYGLPEPKKRLSI